MKTTTLALIIRKVGDKTQTLLGKKKKEELGAGKLTGPGGKLKENETVEECLLRETWEEWRIRLDNNATKKVAIVTFWAEGRPHNQCHIFVIEKFVGELRETPNTNKPIWYDADSLPFDQMFESDKEWYKKAVFGEKFKANIYYHGVAKNFSNIEFLPWEE